MGRREGAAVRMSHKPEDRPGGDDEQTTRPFQSVRQSILDIFHRMLSDLDCLYMVMPGFFISSLFCPE